MEYYDVCDVMTMTGTKQNKSYDIIRKLNKKFKNKYPDAEIIQGKVRKDFYDKVMGKERKDGDYEEEKA